MSSIPIQPMGPHDIGGQPDHDPIDTTDHGMTYWEKHANAMMMVAAANKLTITDERRRYIEGLGERYYEMTYFERHSEALANALCERGHIDEKNLSDRKAEISRRFEETPTLSLPEPSEHQHEDFKEDETGEGFNDFHILNLAVQEILQEKKLISAEEVRAMIEGFESDYPSRGAKVVARAWMDPDYHNRLIEDARPAIEELGIDLGRQARIIALANTPTVHNAVVCTLCSCYPRFLMGHPPTWYKSRSYRSRLVHEPRVVLREFGTELPEDTTIRVHDSNADMRYIVVPMRPEGTEGWTSEQLEEIITRDCLVGVTVPVAG